MPKVFISYRRNDSADATGRLHDRLKARFREEAIFYDIQSIPLGVDFRTYIRDEVSRCDVLLAIIGESWARAADDGHYRLDNPDDLVRIEIETALARDIPVIPVLIGSAAMPSEKDLPGTLKALAYRNAATVRSGADFDHHAERLIHGLEQLLTDKTDIDVRLQKASTLAENDPEIALVPCRVALEIVVREMYERRIGEPPGNRSLEQLSRCLVDRGAFPGSLEMSLVVERLEKIQNHFGTRTHTRADFSHLFDDVMAILKWYTTVEQPSSVTLTHAFSKSHSFSADPVTASRIAIVPKGLRSFDTNDADFFLDLLPGPRDKNGLPESIRFWKHRIEERDEGAFTIGVIYGPSGCGKSSLIKAGLLPHLADHVVPVYVEATPNRTEEHLLTGLRRRCPELSRSSTLTRSISALRKERGLSHGKKVFIVLDQFEQWLHAAAGRQDTELIQALRQCDGEHVQCILTVRDDFWLALSRFLRDLEIRLLEGQNSAFVDLFDPIHARNVLKAFGRAYGRLKEKLSPDEERFLDEAISGLAQDGRVISVRLALFAEMVKGKMWTPSIMQEAGGAEGVGIAFLEEAFSSSIASARNRKHQNAARGVLKALLPEEGSDIKGNMQSYSVLLSASGYSKRLDDFEELLRILDTELRLITGTDPRDSEESFAETDKLERHFQLTHDYLVPSLREWLTRKQRETPEGRAELLLERCALLWSSRVENRPLPTFDQWVTIVTATDESRWTDNQRKMVEEADSHHASFVCDRLLNASTTSALPILDEIGRYRDRIAARLRAAFQEAAARQDSRKQLLASLALLPKDRDQLAYVHSRLLVAEPSEISLIRMALEPFSGEIDGSLWLVLARIGDHGAPARLSAASALAVYSPASEKWDTVLEQLANDFVGVPAVYLASWMELLRPIGGRLLPALEAIFRDRRRRETERSLATNILADYAGDRPDVLAGLLLDADENQFAYLYTKVSQHDRRGFDPIRHELDLRLREDAMDHAKERLAKRQANAAVTLLRSNQSESVWPLLKHSRDPRLRSYLIHRLGLLGVDPELVVRRLMEEPDESIRRALLLSLGEFSHETFSQDDRLALLPSLHTIYQTDPDSGLHAAAEWLLRTWKQDAWLEQVNLEWKSGGKRREGWNSARDSRENKATWWVNGEGQTMVLVPGPVQFEMGSPPSESSREDLERQHTRRIRRSFAVSSKQITAEQYLRFDSKHIILDKYVRMAELPVVGISWHNAAMFCNWLSEVEGIENKEWCYETDPSGPVARPREDHLSLAGYRLPTESEMEYAIRARASTSRYFGETEELLPKYAWYNSNSQMLTWPVGSLKPNDFGLFDAHGNVYVWCHDLFRDYPIATDNEPIDDPSDIEVLVVNNKSRVLRGGSFINPESYVRSANRNYNLPLNWNDYYGFRIAKTMLVE
jgi:formylglycine-generating enzyme required for sulfatase activity